MKKILFLDRDGIINEDVGYLSQIEDIRWKPDIFKGLKYAKSKGYEFIIITNQSGIARGYYTEEDVSILHLYMKSYLAKEGIDILDIYYCPHLPNGAVEEYAVDCHCRKPKSGMLYRAFSDYPIDKERSFMIGDSQRDVDCAQGAGIAGYLYKGENIFQFIKEVIDLRE